jgi:hypothetical protein
MALYRSFLPALGICAICASGAEAEVCDYTPSKLVGGAMSTAAATMGGGAAVAGVGMKAAGYYTLVHASSGLTMLASTAAGASAAGTTGIIAGTGGVGATIASIAMAPITIAVGAITVIGVGTYEGLCYFQIERITDPYLVYGVVESISENDPAVSIETTEDGPRLTLALEEEQKSYMIRDLYIADGQLMHRDFAFNTKLGSVAFVLPAEEDAE